MSDEFGFIFGSIFADVTWIDFNRVSMYGLLVSEEQFGACRAEITLLASVVTMH